MKAATAQDYHERIVRTLVYIQQHLDDALDLDQVASVAAFSSFHFHRIFRGLVGETLKDYAVTPCSCTRALMKAWAGPGSESTAAGFRKAGISCAKRRPSSSTSIRRRTRSLKLSRRCSTCRSARDAANRRLSIVVGRRRFRIGGIAEPVAHPWFREDVLRTRRVILDLFAEHLHVGAQVLQFSAVFRSPHGLQKA
jgi:AraC-like DNA-binding protein